MIITALTEQKKDPERVNVYLDDEFAFGVTVSKLLEYDLYKGKVLKSEEVESIKDSDIVSKAFNKALDYISRRKHSEYELYEKLIRKDIDKKVIATVCAKLTGLGYLDDLDFTESYVRDRKLMKPRGKRMLQMELKKKGVASEIVDMVLNGLSQDDEIDEAVRLIEKKYRGEVDRDTLYRYLAGKGYDYDVIKSAFELTKSKKPSY